MEIPEQTEPESRPRQLARSYMEAAFVTVMIVAATAFAFLVCCCGYVVVKAAFFVVHLFTSAVGQG